MSNLLYSQQNEAILRLLGIGELSTVYPALTPAFLREKEITSYEQVFTYNITPFGTAILKYVIETTRLLDPDVVKHFDDASEPNSRLIDLG